LPRSPPAGHPNAAAASGTPGASRGPQALFMLAGLLKAVRSLARGRRGFTLLHALADANEKPHTLNFGPSGRCH